MGSARWLQCWDCLHSAWVYLLICARVVSQSVRPLGWSLLAQSEDPPLDPTLVRQSPVHSRIKVTQCTGAALHLVEYSPNETGQGRMVSTLGATGPSVIVRCT